MKKYDIDVRKSRNNKKRGFITWSKTPMNLVMPDELKDGKKLESNDEAFHLSSKQIIEIVFSIRSRETPKHGTFDGWDEYARSFYLKMHTCFGFIYQRLGATSESDDDVDDENEKKPLKKHRLEGASKGVKNRKKKEVSTMRQGKTWCCRRIVTPPIEFGSYSSGTEPDRIPYHLYLLVKEAVDIMNNSTNDLTHLTFVEEKIMFFCNYFHSHLPPGWNYEQDKASSLIADYDITRKPRYVMTGYTPFFIERDSLEYEEESALPRFEMVVVMKAINSRKTPSFWRMSPTMIAFYCKLCSCFGIKDYHCLETVPKQDVCLMNMGSELEKPLSSLFRDDWFMKEKV